MQVCWEFTDYIRILWCPQLLFSCLVIISKDENVIKIELVTNIFGLLGEGRYIIPIIPQLVYFLFLILHCRAASMWTWGHAEQGICTLCGFIFSSTEWVLWCEGRIFGPGCYNTEKQCLVIMEVIENSFKHDTTFAHIKEQVESRLLVWVYFRIFNQAAYWINKIFGANISSYKITNFILHLIRIEYLTGSTEPFLAHIYGGIKFIEVTLYG